MAWFRKKKQDSVLPEVDKYYEGERRDRAGLAWLLALVSVIIVALIIIGIFLAGRWAYRQLTNNDGDDVSLVSDNGSDDSNNLPSFDGGTDDAVDSEDSSSDDSANQSGSQGADSDEPAEADQPDESSSQADESSQDGEGGRVDAPVRTDVPSTGDNAPLPNTGPANLVGIFAGVSTLAGGIHYVVERRKLK